MSKCRLKCTQEHKPSPKTFMSATQNADERGCQSLTGEENTTLSIFLCVVFILRPAFFFYLHPN